MEDEKKVVNLAEEKLEQVAGGIGNIPYTGCSTYTSLLNYKKNTTDREFSCILHKMMQDICPDRMARRKFNCESCPVNGKWSEEYNV